MEVTITSNADAVKSAKDEPVERAMQQIGQAAETYAKALCPVGTPESTGIEGYMGGTLRGSITFATSEEHSAGEEPATAPDYETHGTPEKGTVYIGTNVEYAPYVEMGTTKMDARPFLGPAISNNTSEYKNIIESELKG